MDSFSAIKSDIRPCECGECLDPPLEDLLHYYCTLAIPPGARTKSQMTTGECRKTKEVANLRIHVERAINRLKTFRILKNTFPLNMLPLANDIVRLCAAICNIQPPLIKG